MRSVVLVAFGGRSTEHDISVITGVMALNALLGAGEDAMPLYIGRDGGWKTAPWMRDVAQFSGDVCEKTEQPVLLFGSDVLYLKKKNKLKPVAYVRAALSALHGKNGEDGAFPAIMRACRIPVSSPDMTESAILMDKWYAKAAFHAVGAKVLPAVFALKSDFIMHSEKKVDELLEKLPLPLCVKPARLGSSIGISVAKTREELAESLATCFRYDFRAVAEPALFSFDEYGVAVCKTGGRVAVSAPLLQKKRGETFTFAEKYLEGESPAFLFGNEAGGKDDPALETTPAKSLSEPSENDSIACGKATPAAQPAADFITGSATPAAQPAADPTVCEMQKTARAVYEFMHLKGVVRFDFFVADGEVYLNEINTVPGSLAYSYYVSDPAAAGNFFRDLLKQAIAEEREEEALTCAFPSSVLTSFSGGKKNKR